MIPGSRTAYLRTSRKLWQGGVTPLSILAYPLRRRLPNPRAQLSLRNGVVLSAPPDEPLLTMFEETWVDRRYVPHALILLDGDTILDIGGNVGVFAIWAATQAVTRVISAEPSSAMLQYLRWNIARNRLANVLPLHLAIGGTARRSTLFSRGPHAMNTLYERDNYQSTFRPVETVEVTTLDEVFRRHDISRCKLLKIDCEGAEYEILRATSDEAFEKIEAIALEYHVGLNAHGPLELKALLEKRDFAVRILPLEDVESGYLYALRSRGIPSRPQAC
jgi:FkbM family methyltransferase